MLYSDIASHHFLVPTKRGETRGRICVASHEVWL